MAKIVYGVAGEGAGHSSRAREMIEFLQSDGHQVRVASYDRGYKNLKDHFDVLDIPGLGISSNDNKISVTDTVLKNLNILPELIKELRPVRTWLFDEFQPDCVITDFEPITAYLARLYKLPLISLDNQHRMRYMEYTRPAGYGKDALIAETVTRAMVPRPDVSLVTTFHFDKVKNNHTFLFPPILRQDVLSLQPVVGEHILVYATAGFDSLIELLPAFSRETFIIYGYDREATQDNLRYRKFSVQGFLNDLASSKAVIATAGFTLMTEALYLHKPYLALPMQGQFEQVLNANMLQQLGYGLACHEPDQAQIAAFLYQLPDFMARLQDYPREGNTKITEFLASLLRDGQKNLMALSRRDH